MKTAATILAGFLAGVLVAVGILAAFVFVGPDPVGLRPTPSPSPSPVASASPSPVASASPSPVTSRSPSPSSPPIPSSPPSLAPSGSPAARPSPSAGASGSTAAIQVGQPAPVRSVARLGDGQAVLATLEGEAARLDVMRADLSGMRRRGRHALGAGRELPGLD
jgi:hypothetical protein